MIYLLINNIVSAILIFLSFYFGLVNGQRIEKKENVDIFTIIKKRKENKKVQEEQDKLQTIMSNIDAYDGTSEGQKDIPI